MAEASIFRYLEVVEEPSFAPDSATAQADPKSIIIDPSSLALDAPNEADIKTESSFGRAGTSKYAGFYNPSGENVYQIDARTCVQFFKWALGGYAFTGGVAPEDVKTHEAWGSDLRVLPSHQARLGKDVFEHLFQGVIIDTLTLAVEDATTSLSADSSAAIDKDGGGMQSGIAVFNRLPQERHIPFHAASVTIAGVLQQRKVKNLELSIANNTDAEAGRYLGSRYPGRIPANERETVLSMEMDASDKVQLERLWGSATGPTNEGSVLFPVELNFYGGKNAGGQDMNIRIVLPQAFYSAVESQPEGREEQVQAVEAQCLKGTVELADGVTEQVTDIYTSVENMAPLVEAAAA